MSYFLRSLNFETKICVLISILKHWANRGPLIVTPLIVDRLMNRLR